MHLRGVYQKVSPFVATCLYYSGLVPLARLWARRPGQRLIILNYHRAGGDLRRHLLYLRKHYRILPLEAALEEIYTPARDRLPRSDRRTPLAITFDDGYYDNYVHAGALACELQVPISVFLPPGYIDSGSRFHWLEGEYLARHAQLDEVAVAGHTYHLDHSDEREALAQADEREALAQAIDAQVRYARSVAERETFLASARRALTTPACAPAQDAPAEEKLTLPMSWSDVRALEASGWVTYGAHTMHHPLLSCLADPAEVRYEVNESRQVLEQQLGHPVPVIAYPYGGPRDIGECALQAVREAGFRWAVTTIPGFNTPRTDPHLLRRMPTDVSESWLMLAAQAAGVWWGLLQLLKRLLGAPTDTGALPYTPLIRYRRGKTKLILPFG